MFAPVFLLCGGLCWSTPAPASQLVVSNAVQLSNAIAAAKPGDRIVMADGVWTNQQIVFKAQGTEAQPITLCAQTPGKVILNGNSRVQIGGRFLVLEAGATSIHRLQAGSYKIRATTFATMDSHGGI